jgi:hypothetical protein
MKHVQKVRAFARSEDASLSVLSVFMIAVFLVVGAAAVDVSYGFRARSSLQTAADYTAHAALYMREKHKNDEAKAQALALLDANMPQSIYGDVLYSTDIRFGTWDRENQQFTPDSDSKDAVFVTTNFDESRGNGLGLFMMRLLDRNVWDVKAQAVYETYLPMCFREGFVAEGIVDVQSGNTYTNGFCIHSNTHVKVSSNNYFEDSTIVSMPDKGTIELPASGFESNEGLYEALRDGAYRLRILNRLPHLIAVLQNPALDEQDADDDDLPDYITSEDIVTPTAKAKKIAPDDMTPNRINMYSCGGGGSITLETGTYANLVFVTDCDIKLNNGVILDNVVLATTSTADKSISGSHLQIGRDDHCDPDGGSQVLTLGGFEVASDLKVFGGQVLALGDISFSANANGIEGASFISNGEISGTSNMTMGFCGSGMERNYEAEYFRLAK